MATYHLTKIPNIPNISKEKPIFPRSPKSQKKMVVLADIGHVIKGEYG